MNRYEFEDLISDYLEGKMTFKRIKEFESFLKSNEESRTLVNNVRNSISDLNKLDKIVEKLLKYHSYSDCEYIAKKLMERVKWLREYEEKNDYYGD